jgi:FkbM family methyltransferase
MKKSLRQAIRLYPYGKQIKLILLLVLRKAGLSLFGNEHDAFLKLMHLVQLIENGVTFRRVGKGLLEAVLSLNDREIKCLLRQSGSDLKVLETVILQEEYKSAKDYLLTKNNVRIIVDAGANIGLTTLYLFAFFPATKYIVIEPDAENFKLLQQNLHLNGIKNVIALQKALWKNNEPLMLDASFRDGLEWSRSVIKADTNMQTSELHFVEAITLSEVCDLVNDKIDLLKVDIEGAELHLFNDELFLSTLQEQVENLVIEIHDEYQIREKIHTYFKSKKYLVDEGRDVAFFYKLN